jgi:hypothetical protein
MNRLPVPLVLVAACALPLTGCQTTSNIAPHFQGEKWKRLPSASTVQTGRLPEKNLDAHIKQREKQGYVFVGKALFTGEQQGLDQLKGFSASVGADLVEGLVVPVGKEERSYMGISSFTPGRSITSVGASTGYASGTGSGTISSPYGPMNFNTQGSATAYGASTTSTYIPAEITYAPKTYQAMITQQAYMFWLSPKGMLRNWFELAKESNASKPVTEQVPPEEVKRRAAIYAQAWGLPLPANLRPKEPVPQLDEKLLAEVRAMSGKMVPN